MVVAGYRVSSCSVYCLWCLQGVEFGSLAENHLANRYSQLVEFVTTITEDGDMPIITLFSEAIHPNNMVTMLWYLCLVKPITKDGVLLCPILAGADFTVRFAIQHTRTML